MKALIASLMCICFVCSSIFAQHKKSKHLPFYKLPDYPKEMTSGLIMSKMIDELGYKYYWTTEKLLDDQLKKSYSQKNTPRVLVRGLFILSRIAVKSLSHQQNNKNNIKKDMSFNDMRKQTLINFEIVSEALIKVDNVSELPNWKDFGNIIATGDNYSDLIILYRNTNGNLVSSKLEKNRIKDLASEFEESLGVDGFTNETWMKIFRNWRGRFGYGIPQWYIHDFMRRTRQHNATIVAEMRKAQRGTVKVGELKQIGLSSQTVDGYQYSYFGDPPKQLSYKFSNDNEFIAGLGNWVIYINSGNPVSLEEILGLSKDFENSFGVKAEDDLFDNSKNYRDIIDSKGSTIRLEIDEKHFKAEDFSNIKIEKVLINKANSNEIVFIGNVLDANGNIKTSESKIISLKRISGNLLNRIRNNILYIITEDEKYKE